MTRVKVASNTALCTLGRKYLYFCFHLSKTLLIRLKEKLLFLHSAEAWRVCELLDSVPLAVCHSELNPLSLESSEWHHDVAVSTDCADS